MCAGGTVTTKFRVGHVVCLRVGPVVCLREGGRVVTELVVLGNETLCSDAEQSHWPLLSTLFVQCCVPPTNGVLQYQKTFSKVTHSGEQLTVLYTNSQA